jgi:phosphatidylserine decarboxylase
LTLWTNSPEATPGEPTEFVETLMPIAREGIREIALATLILGLCVWGGVWLFWPLAIPFVIVWIWVISFFRDPTRRRSYAVGDLCGPADGTITEATELDYHDAIGGPAIRIGMFLSLFNVHINRAPCSGRVKKVSYRKGEFLDARHPDSGQRNESNTLLIDPDSPMPGPVEVRQVAGLVARRIICHAVPDQHLPIGARFGLIKFGSRTELIIPRTPTTEILVKPGDKVRAGLTIVARQPVEYTQSSLVEQAPTAKALGAVGEPSG